MNRDRQDGAHGRGTDSVGRPGAGGPGMAETGRLLAGIVPLAAHDSDALALLHALSFETPWDATSLHDFLMQAGVFGLGLPDAGFILCRIVADEAEILTLATEPGLRRRGLGRHLVEAAASVAREAGAGRLFLEVGQDNEAALALYARCGFSKVGHRRGYYRRATGLEVDAQVLSLELHRHLPTA